MENSVGSLCIKLSWDRSARFLPVFCQVGSFCEFNHIAFGRNRADPYDRQESFSLVIEAHIDDGLGTLQVGVGHHVGVGVGFASPAGKPPDAEYTGGLGIPGDLFDDFVVGFAQDNMTTNPLKGWENVQEISTYVEMEKRLYRMYSYGLSCDMRVETKYYGNSLEDYMDVILVDKKDYIEEGIRFRIGDYFTVMSEVIENHLNEIEGSDWVV